MLTRYSEVSSMLLKRLVEMRLTLQFVPYPLGRGLGRKLWRRSLNYTIDEGAKQVDSFEEVRAAT